MIKNCRVCAETIDTSYSKNIFDPDNIDIAAIIKEHLNFQLHPNDDYSNVICLICWEKLRDFHEFYIRVMSTQEFLRNEGKTRDTTFAEAGGVSLGEIKEEPVDEVNCQPYDGAFSRSLVYAETLNPLSITENEAAEAKGYSEKPADMDENSCSNSMEIDNDYEVKPDGDIRIDPETTSAVRTRPRKLRNATSKNSSNAEAKSKKHVKLKLKTYNESDDELIRKHIPFNCGECGHNVKNFSELRDHFADQHREIQNAYIRCCGRKISSGKRKYLIQHAYRHENPEHFKCKDCHRVFVDEYALQAHIVANHPSEEDLKFDCDQCEKRFAKKRLLEWHKASHVPEHERTFICYECTEPKGFASNRLLQMHVFAVHKRTRNVCHICAKVIADNIYFERHVRAHTEQIGPRVKCPRPDCQSWLKDKYSLKDHMKRHKDEGKTFECDQCGKKTTNRRALRSHIRNTHSTTIYSCEECNKTFKKALTLKEHMALHTGEKLYKCPFCDRTFNSNANMHSHKKKMHPTEYEIWRKSKMCANPEELLPKLEQILS